MHKDSSVAKGVHTDRVPSHSVKHDNTTTTATTIDPDWSYAAFQRVASAGAWPSFRCTKGLARGAGSGSASTGCRMTPPARPEKGFYTPDTGFQFARTEEECCGARGTAHFWQELVQLDDPVRFAGGRKQPGKEHHHEMIPRLMRHLAANCPCRGVVWLGIGAHELKHGRPWYQDPSTIEYGPREWQREAESKWCVSLLRAAAAARGGGGLFLSNSFFFAFIPDSFPSLVLANFNHLARSVATLLMDLANCFACALSPFSTFFFLFSMKVQK
jgi:hypothetical protein